MIMKSIHFASIFAGIILNGCSANLTSSALLTSPPQSTPSIPTSGYVPPANAIGLTEAYTNANYLSVVSFGNNSQWVQPWRAELTTRPASTFINGLGINFNTTNLNSSLFAQMLASHGIKHGRIEIGWGALDYATESTIDNAAAITAQIQAMHAHGIRPLILLNGNSGGPCPYLMYTHVLTAPAAAGATTIQLDNVSNLVVGYSGVSSLTSYWMAEDLITGISGNTVTLSKPLPNAIASGTTVTMATLKYRPFSTPAAAVYNSADVAATLAGWGRYVKTVSQFVANSLGVAAGSPDMGFDMEIWNELSFDSNYLQLSLYYGQSQASDEGDIWGQIVQETANVAAANPTLFGGVTLADGFSNTVPWPCAGLEPVGINAISKHPYPPTWSFPSAREVAPMVNALFQTESTALFVPTYTSVFAEAEATSLQTENVMRDMSSITSYVGVQAHGEYARGLSSPVNMMMTEMGINPAGEGVTDLTAARLLKAKLSLRTFAFYLNKGVTQIDMYSAIGTDDTDFGLIQNNFVTYAGSNNTYPLNDAAYVSPTLLGIENMLIPMQLGLDTSLTLANTRALTVNNVLDTHSNYQFVGDGTSAHPNLYDREVFTFLPYQVNAHRFVIPYYVMTRNELTNLPPEDFILDVSGLHGIGASVSAIDPLTGNSVPVTLHQASTNEIIMTVTSADYPYLLIVDEVN